MLIARLRNQMCENGNLQGIGFRAEDHELHSLRVRVRSDSVWNEDIDSSEVRRSAVSSLKIFPSQKAF